jgi:type 1 glutamine amidotransferase
VKLTVPEHPALRGLPAALNADDELYHGYRFQRGVDMQVLATAFDAPEIGGTGRDEPVYWTVNHGRGRVFHITLGHDARAMAMPAFAWVLPRAALWLAGRGQ